jgi:ATP-dependent RNA helicase DHX36
VQGAVLVFLPGWDDIMRLKDRLEASLPATRWDREWSCCRLWSRQAMLVTTTSSMCVFRSYLLLPLHSMVPAAEQRRVFVRPPAGTRKIVLATNIGALACWMVDIRPSSYTSPFNPVESDGGEMALENVCSRDGHHHR